MNLSTVKWAQWDKTQSRDLLGLFICVCIALCTIVAHNIAQNRPDNFPPYPPDNHHCSDDVYLREGGRSLKTLSHGSLHCINFWQVHLGTATTARWTVLDPLCFGYKCGHERQRDREQQAMVIHSDTTLLNENLIKHKAYYEVTRTEKMRHFEREQISVQWYQVKRKLFVRYVSMDSFTFKYQLTDMKLQHTHHLHQSVQHSKITVKLILRHLQYWRSAASIKAKVQRRMKNRCGQLAIFSGCTEFLSDSLLMVLGWKGIQPVHIILKSFLPKQLEKENWQRTG